MKSIISIVAALIVVVGSLTAYASHEDAKLMASLKSGEKELWCHINVVPHKIEPHKIKRKEEHGWRFTNGYSELCEVRTASQSAQ